MCNSNDDNPDLSCDDEIGGGVLEQLSDSMPLNMSTSATNNAPGFAPAQVGEMEIKGRVFPLEEVLEMIERKCQDYDQGAAGSGEGGISFIQFVFFSDKGWELKEFARQINVLLKWAQDRDDKILPQVYNHGRGIKKILDQGAARGGEGGFAHLTQCEVDKLTLRTNALFDLIAAKGCSCDSCNFARRQSNPLISSLTKGCEADEFERWNYPLGFAPAGTSRARSNMFLESHSIDIKDEKPKSTDFIFRKPNNMFLEWVVALFFSLCVTGMHATALMPPKCFLRIILGLLTISLTCHFAVIVFYKKLPAKIANLALSLAITCNGCSILLMAGFFLAKI